MQSDRKRCFLLWQLLDLEGWRFAGFEKMGDVVIEKVFFKVFFDTFVHLLKIQQR